MTNLLILAAWLSIWVSQLANLMMDYKEEIIMFVGLVLFLCGIGMGIRYIWQKWVRDFVVPRYYRFVKNPYNKMMKPFRRFHRKYSERNARVKQAKYEERIIADKILDVLYDEVTAGRISKYRFRKLQTQMGEFFNIPDLRRKKLHPDAIKAKIKQERVAQAGPVGEIPGGKPGENHIPVYRGLGHKYLAKKQA